MSNRKRKTTPAAKSAKPAAGNDASADANADVQVIINVLLEVAGNARENAYAPYSGYPVGAALLTTRGDVFSGCNVENVSIGLTICAERAAVVKAVSEGQRSFEAIAIVTADGGSPCGSCRQFLSEFGLDIMVILSDIKGKYRMVTLRDLLPLAFEPYHVHQKNPAHPTASVPRNTGA